MAADRRSNWLKRVLDLPVPSCLTGGENYGFEISKAFAGAGIGDIEGGTLHPVLNRLEEAGPVVGEFRAAERGPGRRYYRLTDEGRRGLATESGNWLESHTTVRNMLRTEAAS
ncbi:PadR family transcriptional regulator [Streptomyces sp. PSRA5]|uniref:PadR family transcriptional regulator n=1 Tax=Streptomyces panacea TaxID=3035064 RepID=UPI00339BE045